MNDAIIILKENKGDLIDDIIIIVLDKDIIRRKRGFRFVNILLGIMLEPRLYDYLIKGRKIFIQNIPKYPWRNIQLIRAWNKGI